jgi:Lon-like protease
MEGVQEGMNNRFRFRSFLIILILFAISFFYHLPFYVSQPGIAKELEPIIHVEGGNDAKGALMLTTVRMGKANIYSYLLAKWSEYQEIYPEHMIKGEDETEEEYSVRQLQMMEGSKDAAIMNAYKAAGKKMKVKYGGVYVVNVLEGMPAEEKLKPGDRISEIDGIKFTSSKQFMEYIAKKQEGKTVSVTFTRDDTKMTERIMLKPLKGTGKIGIGITLVDDRKITTDPPVTIDTDQIGGPSAGLMFSLEIYNQLMEEDITKGYKIAGTGTINENGEVGPIGGIEQKIIAADKSGADIFLAPNENGAKDSNYQAAVKTAKDIGSDMKIIPVDSFKEALDFLHTLKPR